MDVNPYESPREPCALTAADAHSSWAGMTARFTVNAPGPHEVEVYCSRWTGLEVYRIDGIERLRAHSFGVSATREFALDDNAVHDITLAEPGRHVLTITVKTVPWWSGTASLDGRLVVGDLFPSERARGMTLFAIMVALVLTAAGWLTWHARDLLEAF